jgi:hypothetical protein
LKNDRRLLKICQTFDRLSQILTIFGSNNQKMYTSHNLELNLSLMEKSLKRKHLIIYL